MGTEVINERKEIKPKQKRSHSNHYVGAAKPTRADHSFTTIFLAGSRSTVIFRNLNKSLKKVLFHKVNTIFK